MLLLYVIFFFLILRFTVTLFNFISNPKLTPSAYHYTDLVSILIPAVREEDDLLTLLQSIRAQDYKNYEVLIVKKASFNSTCESGLTFIEQDPRFKFIELPEISSGAAYENSVCTELCKRALGKYFMFVDSRSIVANGLINNSVHRMKIQQLALLGLLSNQIMPNIGERLVVPLINYLLLNLVPLRLIRLSKNPAFAISCGQFMMFDAKIYKEHNWHSLVKNNTDADIDLMRLIKNHGYHAEALLANGFLYSRMYTGFTAAVEGISNSIISNFGTLTALLIYIFMVIAGPAAMAIYMDIELLLFAVTLVVLSRIMISLASGQNAWLNVLLHPLQIISFILIVLIAIRKHFTKSVTWKQRNIGY